MREDGHRQPRKGFCAPTFKHGLCTDGADGRRVCPRRGAGLRIWRSFRWRKLKHKGCNSATWSLNSPVAPKIHLKLEARRRRREACRAPSALSSGHSRRRVRKVPLRRVYIYPRPTSGSHVSPPKARTRVGHLVSVKVSTCGPVLNHPDLCTTFLPLSRDL